MTVVAVPVKQERFKMITQLRSIALITGTFTEVSLHRILHQYSYVQRRNCRWQLPTGARM
jgi:hypothetical protein